MSYLLKSRARSPDGCGDLEDDRPTLFSLKPSPPAIGGDRAPSPEHSSP
ncbi:hypothetical protein [Oxynema aestuarii]|uniref:Uncharacterized protein n=1 Tax=Oxynema aestuarii AP17 TaxID=2064643 RepID=A0A6H1TVG1_9CYAN|nr:hypothetical protein [Oxynema aestuarii]QIZ70614.1 hypothetical protein HCG48_08505 [Oxynema aestuarii AP17]